MGAGGEVRVGLDGSDDLGNTREADASSGGQRAPANPRRHLNPRASYVSLPGAPNEHYPGVQIDDAGGAEASDTSGVTDMAELMAAHRAILANRARLVRERKRSRVVLGVQVRSKWLVIAVGGKAKPRRGILHRSHRRRRRRQHEYVYPATRPRSSTPVPMMTSATQPIQLDGATARRTRSVDARDWRWRRRNVLPPEAVRARARVQRRSGTRLVRRGVKDVLKAVDGEIDIISWRLRRAGKRLSRRIGHVWRRLRNAGRRNSYAPFDGR